MAEDVDFKGLPNALHRDVDDRSAFHDAGVQHQDIGIERARVSDVDRVEQIQLDYLEHHTGLGCVRTQAANLRPRFGRRHDVVAKARKFNCRTTPKT